MGVSAWLARRAVARLHVLVVEGQGGFRSRVVAEQACRARGWTLALSPADADVLLVCGKVADGTFADSVASVWAQLPGPRVRVGAADATDVAAALDTAATRYLDSSAHRRDAHRRREDATSRAADEGSGVGDMSDGDMSDGDMSDGDMEMEMDMSGPGGIALASGAEDRDGLEMDVLHLRLGPVLSGWPSQLAVWCTLSGDVVVGAEVEVLGPETEVADRKARAAVRLGRAADVLALAGSLIEADRLRGFRDRLLTAADGHHVGELAEVTARLRRSRTLRWSLRDLGRVDAVTLAGHGLPDTLAGDVRDRLLRLLDQAAGDLADPAANPAAGPAPHRTPEPAPDLRPDRAPVAARPGALDDFVRLGAALPDLLAGTELAGARLLVASLLGHGAASAAARTKTPAGAHRG